MFRFFLSIVTKIMQSLFFTFKSTSFLVLYTGHNQLLLEVSTFKKKLFGLSKPYFDDLIFGRKYHEILMTNLASRAKGRKSIKVFKSSLFVLISQL